MKLTFLFSAFLIVSRIWIGANIPPDSFAWVQIYKDVAHLFMGGLMVAWWFQRAIWQWRLFWLLNAVEVTVAILSRV